MLLPYDRIVELQFVLKNFYIFTLIGLCYFHLWTAVNLYRRLPLFLLTAAVWEQQLEYCGQVKTFNVVECWLSIPAAKYDGT